MPFKWWRGLIAYAVVIAWPGLFPRWMFWILPWAGDYAYWNDPWVRWCREANYRPLVLEEDTRP